MNESDNTSGDLTLVERIFTSASEGIIIIDPAGKIILANPSAQQLFGYSPGELEGLDLEVLMPERYRESHPKHRRKFSSQPKSRKMGIGLDLFALRKDKKEFPVEISLSSFRSAGQMLTAAFIIDITLRKENEEKLRKSQQQLKEYSEQLEDKVLERTRELEHLNLGLQSQVQERKYAEATLLEAQELYKAIAANFPNGIITVLDLDLRYVFVSGAEMATRNWTEDMLIGQSFLEFAPNSDRLPGLLTDLKQGREFSMELESGESHYQLQGVPLRDDKGVIFQLLLVEENITKQKKAEEEIKNSLLKEKELNELKTRFVSMASHEFRTPLSTILSSVALIGKYPNDAREQREKHIQRIKSAINNLTNILNDFLSIGKLEEGKIQIDIEEVELADLLVHIKEEMDPTLKTNQKLLMPKVNGIKIKTDPKILKNAFLNLISNASKYSEPGSPIEVTFSKLRGGCQFAVKDEGYGIPKEEQSNIFDRFYRAANAVNLPGTGLGLNIVKKYIELLQGEVEFVSEVGVGTTFTITLLDYAQDLSDRGQ